MIIPLRSKYVHTSCRFEWSRPLLVTRFLIRTSNPLTNRRHVNGYGGAGPGQLGPQGDEAEETTNAARKMPGFKWTPTLMKMFESSATTLASILVLGCGLSDLFVFNSAPC